jgi:hypothetical protein
MYFFHQTKKAADDRSLAQTERYHDKSDFVILKMVKLLISNNSLHLFVAPPLNFLNRLKSKVVSKILSNHPKVSLSWRVDRP